MREIEIQAICGMNEQNTDALKGMVESYRKMLFPGTGSVEDKAAKELEARKAALAKEAEKAFIVRPVDIKQMLKKSVDNPEYAKLAGKALAEHERQRIKDLQRQQRAKARQKKG